MGSPLDSSFRDGPKDQTRNLEIPGSCFARPGMTCYPNKKAPAKPGPFVSVTPPTKSARIEFDDQMRLHLHRERHVRQRRDAGEFRRHLGVVDFEEIRHVALGKLERLQNVGKLLRGLLDLDEVADLYLEARDIDAAAVHLDVAMIDELACGEHGGDEFG